MAALLSTQYALLALALLFLAAQRCRDGLTPAACVSMLIAAGLCYDNVVLALGGALLAGPLLLALNWPRYLLQALIDPLFLLSFADVYRRACGGPWLAWTALAMLIGCGASAALGRDGVCLVTNGAELLLLAAVLAGTRHLRLGHCRVSPPYHGVSVRRNL